MKPISALIEQVQTAQTAHIITWSRITQASNDTAYQVKTLQHLGPTEDHMKLEFILKEKLTLQTAQTLERYIYRTFPDVYDVVATTLYSVVVRYVTSA